MSTLWAIFVYFQMIAIEQFSNNLAAAIGFLVGVTWIAYKLNWFGKIAEWYSNKIKDPYGIVVPALMTMLLPFIFTYFSKDKIPEILRIILPLATFALGQNFQFYKDVKQKEEAWKFYFEAELFNIVSSLNQCVSRLDDDANLMNQDDDANLMNQDISQYFPLPIQQIDEIESWDLIKAIAPSYLLDNGIIFMSQKIIKGIKEYNCLVEEREQCVQAFDNSPESCLSLLTIDTRILRSIDKLFGSLNFLSNKLGFQGITLQVNALRNDLDSLSKKFGSPVIIPPSLPNFTSTN